MICPERIISAYDGMTSHVAVVDSRGIIVWVNTAWRRFASENNSPDPRAYLGTSYLDACDRAAVSGSVLAVDAVAGIRRVLSGDIERFAQRYPCHSPTVERWFIMTVSRSTCDGDIVIVHEDLTPLIQAEKRSAAAERRLRLCLEAGEIGTFTIDREKKQIVLDARQAVLFDLPPDCSELTIEELETRLDLPIGSFEPGLLHRGERHRDELKLRLPTGAERWLSLAVAPEPVTSTHPSQFFGISFDVTPRKLEEQRERLITDEIRHRAKNIISIVAAISHQIAGKGPHAEFADQLSDRIVALGRTIDLLAEGEANTLAIDDLFVAQLKPLTGRESFALTGPPLRLKGQAAQALGMALHELATNSLKYGALSNPEGRVVLEWTIGGPDRSFRIRWREYGGPKTGAWDRQGFGYAVLMNAIAWTLNAHFEVHRAGSVLIWELHAPLDKIAVDFEASDASCSPETIST